jgi:uncharacterized protein GlcG (DUF336 family)
MLVPRPAAATLLALLALAPTALRAQQRADARASDASVVLPTTTLSLEGARRVLEGAIVEARANRWAVSIAIVDASGLLVHFARLDDASPASADVSVAKARTAARFRRPSKALEETVAGGRVAVLSLPDVVAVEGGVPIVVGGRIVGAIGVSGATSAQDGQVAQAGARAVATP